MAGGIITIFFDVAAAEASTDDTMSRRCRGGCFYYTISSGFDRRGV